MDRDGCRGRPCDRDGVGGGKAGCGLVGVPCGQAGGSGARTGRRRGRGGGRRRLGGGKAGGESDGLAFGAIGAGGAGRSGARTGRSGDMDVALDRASATVGADATGPGDRAADMAEWTAIDVWAAVALSERAAAVAWTAADWHAAATAAAENLFTASCDRENAADADAAAAAWSAMSNIAAERAGLKAGSDAWEAAAGRKAWKEQSEEAKRLEARFGRGMLSWRGTGHHRRGRCHRPCGRPLTHGLRQKRRPNE